jgi:RNA polymerase sigma-70 factor, ECF subfamily
LQAHLKYNTEDLISGLKEKNLNILSAIYDQYAPSVFGVIVREIDEVKTAEQILENTFATMWNNPEIDERYNKHFLLWMISIAKVFTVQALSNISVTNSTPQELVKNEM